MNVPRGTKQVLQQVVAMQAARQLQAHTKTDESTQSSQIEALSED